jgi:DNA-binding NarL/FixJ family response regulator
LNLITQNTKPNLIIVDDHLVFRRGLSSFISIENFATVIGEAADGAEFIDLLSHLQPDLVLMDIDMPGMNGMEATQKALELIPGLKIIALTMFGDDAYFFKMVELGVKGFLLKSSSIDDLEKAILQVMQGQSYYPDEDIRKTNSNLKTKKRRKLSIDKDNIPLS